MIAIPDMKMPKSCNECMNECINIPLECYPDGDTVPDCPLIEIVRCGECKKHGKNSCPMTFTYAAITDDNNYCSYAERGADENALGR